MYRNDRGCCRVIPPNYARRSRESLDDVKYRLGHLHEEVIRHAICRQRMKISSISSNRVSKLLSAINGRASAYRKLIIRAQTALQQPDVTRSRFLSRIKATLDFFKQHMADFGRSAACEPDHSIKSAEQYLTFQLDSNESTCFILLWFLIDGGNYIPPN